MANLILSAQLKAGLKERSGVPLQATITKIRSGASALMVRIPDRLKPHTFFGIKQLDKLYLFM